MSTSDSQRTMPTITAMESLLGEVVLYRPKQEDHASWSHALASQPQVGGARLNPMALVPTIVVAVITPTTVNLRALVDGTVCPPWITSVVEGDGPGQWRRRSR